MVAPSSAASPRRARQPAGTEAEGEATAMGAGATLVSGGTGYLGGLILARLLVEEPTTTFLVLVRRPITFDAWFQTIALELELAGQDARPFRERLRLAQLPALDRMTELDPIARELGVDRMIHAAGC